MDKPHFNPDRNVFVAGITRGGKTVTGNEMHALFDGLSIFWNPEEENNVVGYLIDSPNHVAHAALTQGWDSKLDYRPKSYDQESQLQEMKEMQKFLFELADATGRRHNIQLVVDEAHITGRQGSKNSALKTLVKRGLKRNIKVVPMSQDPATVAKTIVRQCDYNLWVGGFNPYYEPYFKQYNLPTTRIKGQAQGDYTVFRKAEKIATGRADSKFA